MMPFRKILKRIIPKSLILLRNKILLNKIMYNYYNKDFRQKALLSYIVEPFRKKGTYLGHTNHYEALSWAKILDELGFIVDIADCRSTKEINLDKYDLICGIGDIFQKRFESAKCKALTITYGPGRHPMVCNIIALNRLKDVYSKKQAWLSRSIRFNYSTLAHSNMLTDGIIALGNEVCADSYRQYYDGAVYSLPAPFYETQKGENIIKQRNSSSKQHYLWFGSSGLIHKGLDLCLDYFSQNQDLFLHICGPVENEKEFVDAYKKELFEMSNVKLHGFIDISSKEFETILVSCSFVIHPSCSEGGSPSVLTTVGNGGLIPIITKETTVETGHEIWIDGFDYASMDRAIKHSQSLSFDEIKDLQHKNLVFVKTNHTQKKYYDTLKQNIIYILESKK